MSRKHKEPCGCIIDASDRYVSMCPEHYAEWKEVHDRWNADYRANHPLESASGVTTTTGTVSAVTALNA